MLRVILAVLRKDLGLFWRSPAVVAVTLLPPVILLLTLLMESAAVGSLPVALVGGGHGKPAREAARTLAAYPGFRTVPLSPGAAQVAFDRLEVAGVLTVPKNFTKVLAAGGSPIVTLQVRNFNADFTDDLLRDLPDALGNVPTPGVPRHRGVTIGERDLQPRDANFLGFQMVAVLVLLLLQAGIVNAGMAAVHEWQSGTVKELLLAPAPAMAVLIGKVLAGVVAADVVGVVLGGLSLWAGFFGSVTPGNLLLALLVMTLLSAVGSGIGVGLASAMRSFERLGPASMLMSFYLFFLAGGIAAVAFLPGWLRAIAEVIPNFYGMDALRGLLLYGSSQNLGRDVLVLGIWLVLVLAAGPRLLHRSLSR